MGEVISLLEYRQRKNVPVVHFEERLHVPPHEQAERFKHSFLKAATALVVGGTMVYMAYDLVGAPFIDAAKSVYNAPPLSAPHLP